LTGSIPSLSGLTALQGFYVGSNQLTGAIPSLSGLTALSYFDASSNQLTGSIPSLSGLTALQVFYVPDNQLTGSIPSLSGLTALQDFYVGANQLTGAVPAPPGSLLAGKSDLCSNNLVSSGNPTVDAAWDTAQGGSWLACQATALSYNLSVAISGTGSGVVTSGDGSINCGATCSSIYATGDFVYLTASPDPGSAFTGWGGACTGTGGCPVAMDAAKHVTAAFDSVPFAVVTTGVIDGIITDPFATVTATITVNPADVGQTRSVFITALVPANFLPPSAGRSFKAMAQLAAANPDALVLAQLTPSGWQPVVDGQLIPYVTGVLGEQLAAQTILDNVDTSGLIGSQFCVGYGESAEEMASAGRMQLIAFIPDPNAANPNTRSCNVALPISDDQVFAYAEANYASFFPLTDTSSGQYQQYNYRFYPVSGNYLGVDTSKMIYLYGPVNGYIISPGGLVEYFRSAITGWEATLSP
jgi:hypothetical protein